VAAITKRQLRSTATLLITRLQLLLDRESAYAVAHELARQQGESFPVGKKTLGKRLQEDGILARQDQDRSTTQVTIGSVRRRVWCIKAEVAQSVGLVAEED
jgi:hypothetical protein